MQEIIPGQCWTADRFPTLPDDHDFRDFYKIPVVAWMVTKHSKTNRREYFVNCFSIVVGGDDGSGEIGVTGDDLTEDDEIVSVIPARPGTYRVMGIHQDHCKHDELIGHIIPE